MTTCKLCQSSNIAEHQDIEHNHYKGEGYDVAIDYSVCGNCGREFISKPQILSNEARVREAKKKIDGLLSAEEIVAVRKKLNLTQSQAAEVFGGGKNAFSKYERSEVTQSAAMDKLLRLAAEDGYIYKKLTDLSSKRTTATRSIGTSTHMIPPMSNTWSYRHFNKKPQSHNLSQLPIDSIVCQTPSQRVA